MNQNRAGNTGGGFSLYRPMIQAADGLTLRQVCSITGLEPSTVQNWIRRGFVAHPVEKKYRERQLARILLISELRDCMKIDSIGALLATVNGDADDTGDDIISEEQLYEEVTQDYVPTDETAARRLNAALTVMVYAYTAGQYKKEADRRLQSILGEQGEAL